MPILQNLTNWFRSGRAPAAAKDVASPTTEVASPTLVHEDPDANEAAVIAFAALAPDQQLPFLVNLADNGQVAALDMLTGLKYSLADALTSLAEANDAAGIRSIMATQPYSIGNETAGVAAAFGAAAVKNNVDAMAAFPPKNIRRIQKLSMHVMAVNASASGSTEAVGIIAQEIVQRSKENTPFTHMNITACREVLSDCFKAAAAKGHDKTAAVVLRTLNACPFAQEKLESPPSRQPIIH